MDKAELKRHDLIFVTEAERKRIWQQLASKYEGAKLELVRDVFLGKTSIPGIVRRSEEPCEGIALGFVHYQRINDNRIRIGAYSNIEEVVQKLTPYEVLKKALSTRTRCMEACLSLAELAKSYGLEAGVLGSAGLEIATELPYTDAASDLDFLIKPSDYNCMKEFYNEARTIYAGINMDFELDIPNGYGVKLAEIFMNTRTVLGKSINDVDLLDKQEVLKYLK